MRLGSVLRCLAARCLASLPALPVAHEPFCLLEHVNLNSGAVHRPTNRFGIYVVETSVETRTIESSNDAHGLSRTLSNRYCRWGQARSKPDRRGFVVLWSFLKEENSILEREVEKISIALSDLFCFPFSQAWTASTDAFFFEVLRCARDTRAPNSLRQTVESRGALSGGKNDQSRTVPHLRATHRSLLSVLFDWRFGGGERRSQVEPNSGCRR